MTTAKKWAQRLVLLAAPLALAATGVALPATSALAWTDTDIVVFTVQPTTTQVSTAMTPAVVVQVEEPNGYLDKGYNGPVTLTYAANQIGAPEPTGNTVKADQGVATFSGLTFSAVGFGFELQASISDGTTSPASAPFNIVTQLVQCQPGQSCQSQTVSSEGTSGSVTAATAETSDVLTATGGGFPALSCTKYGGVLNFTVTNRSKVITVTLTKSAIQAARGKHRRHFTICWGSPTPFTTLNGTTSVFNPAHNQYEGLLPFCRADGGVQPCIKEQRRTKCNRGDVVSTVDAPPGDPYIGY